MATRNQTTLPDDRGRFGDFGGKFVPETLMAALDQLEEAYWEVKEDNDFQDKLTHLLRTYAGRPTALYYAENLSRHVGGARIYLKREDLAHTGAHKINNGLGQALLAQHMGKKRIIAETGAGTARGRFRHRLRHAGTGMYRLYGGRGHTTTVS